jgi:hypothetical protein
MEHHDKRAPFRSERRSVFQRVDCILLQEISDLISTFPAKTVLLSKLGCELRLNHSDILDKLQYLRLRIGTFLANHPEVFCITGERGTEQVRLLSPGEQRATADPPLALHNGEPATNETSTQDEALEQVRQELKAILKKQGRPVLLSTIGTIVSPSFKNALSRSRCKLKVFARACPDFQLTNDLPGCEMIGLADNRSAVNWTPQALTHMKDMDTGEVVAGIKLQRPRKGPREEKGDYRAIRDFRDEDSQWESRDRRENGKFRKGDGREVYYGSAGKDSYGPGGGQQSYEQGYGSDYFYEPTTEGFQNGWKAAYYGDGTSKAGRDSRPVGPGQMASTRSDIYSLDNQRNGDMVGDAQLTDASEPYRYGSTSLNMPRIAKDQEDGVRSSSMPFASDRLGQGNFGMPLALGMTPDAAGGMLSRSMADGDPGQSVGQSRSIAERRVFGFDDLGIQTCKPEQKPLGAGQPYLESSALYSSPGPLTPIQLDLSGGPRSPPVSMGGQANLGLGRAPRVDLNPMIQSQPTSLFGHGQGRPDDSPLYYNVTQAPGGVPFSNAFTQA